MGDAFEIAFSFDTTGSMYSCLEEVRKRLREMVQDLKRTIPGIKIAIFAHGDYCDAGSTYVTKYVNFTNDPNTLCNFVSNVGGTGGGDTPECYELVLREVQENLAWSTNSQKSLVMIGDAPPHEKSESQNYRRLDWKEEIERLRKMDIKVYAVQVTIITGDEKILPLPSSSITISPASSSTPKAIETPRPCEEFVATESDGEYDDDDDDSDDENGL
ncbi:uncharacterized protein LOC132715283 [Ruditapes philippinarum]|uniref:uncharacterized protein LOC132715283 n=1 Tax=Ruditapes philippinarum TaxID=129788 RepID=UPI00295A9266|nr:uncharacterized protein LOC132715283 [Ruditapes philippinarum]